MPTKRPAGRGPVVPCDRPAKKKRPACRGPVVHGPTGSLCDRRRAQPSGQDLCPSHRAPPREQPALYDHDDQEWLEEASQPAQPWTQPQTYHFPVEQHPWADHIINLLVSHGFLPARAQVSLSLSCWSDCSGINSEGFSMADLSAAMRKLMGVTLEWNLYYTCDKDPRCLEFAKLNHNPKHFSNDMEKRCFKTGKFWCELCEANHDMPASGVDVYIGTFPCSPWARRGKRTGMSHPDARCLLIGVQTIVALAPAVFIIELGEMPNASAKKEIMDKIGSIHTKCSRARYVIHDLAENLDPSWAAYCVRRSRFFVIGWRSDTLGGQGHTTATDPLKCIIEHPLKVPRTNYFTFLGLPCDIDWSRVHAYPTPQELEWIRAHGCTCGVSPLSICPQHPCTCGHCGAQGLECAWRSHLLKLVADAGLERVISHNSNTLTYLQVLEMHGRSGPATARLRITINVLAMKCEAQPLQDTLMIADLSQNFGFGSILVNGDVPTLTTKSHLHSFRAGMRLTAYHLAALEGLDTTKMKFAPDMSPSWFAQRLGLGVHVANFGMVLMGALAVPMKGMLRAVC